MRRFVVFTLVGIALSCGEKFAVAPVETPAPIDASPPTKPGDPPRFVKRVLDANYRAEGVGVLDVDKDGHLDIVTDQLWWKGPRFETRFEIRTPQTWDPAAAFAECFGVFPADLDGDGWADIIVAPHYGDAMYWYANPKGADAHWQQHVITPAGVAGLENPIVVDLFGSGAPVLLMTDSVRGTLSWYEPPAGDPTQPWIAHDIDDPFPGSSTGTHGIGAGDVDGDGRRDVLTAFGWFGQPAEATGSWSIHPFVSNGNGQLCHRMWTQRVDGDALADIFCSRPHQTGIFWYQQLPEGGFVEHPIDTTISQMHGLELADLDGDGTPELVSGKRWWAEGPSESGPAVVVYYTMKGTSFERHIVDDDSGIGVQFTIRDVDGDGKADIVTANKKGIFLFTQQ